MKDNFSQQAASYARYRPDYPESLYAHILSLTNGRACAWDCATGNGQAALRLAQAFDRVEATDISAKQLAKAPQADNVHYQVSRAEETPFADDSFDLITVAQAAHWFDYDRFYPEVRRVGKPGALLAMWGYGLGRVTPEIDAVVDHYYNETLGPYWDPERRHIDAGYRTIPFPLNDAGRWEGHIVLQWSRTHFMGMFETWSALQHYLRQNEDDPTEALDRRIRSIWKEDSTREIRFPLFLLTGRV